MSEPYSPGPGTRLALAIGAQLLRLGAEPGCIIEVTEHEEDDGPVFRFGPDTARALLGVLAKATR